MKSLANSKYHNQHQERSAKAVPGLEEQLALAGARVAEVEADRAKYQNESRFKQAHTGAVRAVENIRQRLNRARAIASGEIKPYLTEWGHITWK